MKNSEIRKFIDKIIELHNEEGHNTVFWSPKDDDEKLVERSLGYEHRVKYIDPDTGMACLVGRNSWLDLKNVELNEFVIVKMEEMS